MSNILIPIDEETGEMLEAFAALVQKNKQEIVREALVRYFVQEEERLAREKERSLTTFSYDEFWDGLDIG